MLGMAVSFIITISPAQNNSVRNQWLPVVKAAAEHYKLDWKLLDALILTESNWNPMAVSPVGAMGLTQLMPATAEMLKVNDPHDPGQAIWGAAWYLRQLNDRFSNWRLTLGAYNAGPHRVARCECVPPFVETQNYVSKIERLHREFAWD